MAATRFHTARGCSSRTRDCSSTGPAAQVRRAWTRQVAQMCSTYLTGVCSSLQVSCTQHPGGDEAVVDLRLVAALCGEQRNHGRALKHAGLPWEAKPLPVCVCLPELTHTLRNSPSSSVAPHPEIQHMVPASKSSLWFGRQMGSTNPAEDGGHQLQHGPQKASLLGLGFQKNSLYNFGATSFKKAKSKCHLTLLDLQQPSLFLLGFCCYGNMAAFPPHDYR